MKDHFAVKVEMMFEAGDKEEAMQMAKDIVSKGDGEAWDHYDGYCIVEADGFKYQPWGWTV